MDEFDAAGSGRIEIEESATARLGTRHAQLRRDLLHQNSDRGAQQAYFADLPEAQRLRILKPSFRMSS
jgi:hypothetical protein